MFLKRIPYLWFVSVLAVLVLSVLSVAPMTHLTRVGGATSRPISLVVQGLPLVTDVAPVMQSGRVLVPFRAIGESLGATVEWYEQTNSVVLTLGSVRISLRLGDRNAIVNDRVVQLDVPAAVRQGRTMVPLRFVSEALGFRVAWDEPTATVTVGSALPHVSEIRVDPSTVHRGQQVGIAVIATDPDGDALTYTYQVSAGQIIGSGSAVMWRAPAVLGTQTITALVSDGTGGVVSRNLNVQVVNRPPAIENITTNPTVANHNQPVAINVVTHDPDGDTLTYSYRITGGTIQGTGANVTWLAPDTTGTFTITVIVSDGQGGIAERSVTVRVAAQYTLALTSAGATTGGGSYEAGAIVSVSTSVPPGSRFISWTNRNQVVSTTASFSFVMPANDTTLIANFGPAPLSAAEVLARMNPAVVSIATFDGAGRALGQGTGFIVRPDGFIVTNQRLIGSAHSAMVTLANGSRHPMQRMLAQGVTRDVAVFRIDATNLPTVQLGDTSLVSTGDQILAIVNQGASNTITTGQVSLRTQTIGGQAFIQISTPTPIGANGGVMVDHHARVLGLTTATHVVGPNLNLVIPIEEVVPFIESAVAVSGVVVPPVVPVWVAVDTSGDHSLAIRNDGTLWAWGSNSAGQLGLGHRNDTHHPTRVGTASHWVAVSTGSQHSMAISSDGTLWTWGRNDVGQLGLGDTRDRETPTRTGTGAAWVSIDAGGWHSLGIRADGTLWAWGLNVDGQLGLAHANNAMLPTQVGTTRNWVEASAGQWHSLARQRDGTLWAWGYNGDGQLGLGHSAVVNTPTRVGTANDWTNVSGGRAHSLGLRRDGSLWAWGSSQHGALGLGDAANDDRTVPARVGADTNWAHISAGLSHSTGLRADGTLWTWGNNTAGQLGLGDFAGRTSPFRATNAQAWRTVVAGGQVTIALTPQGAMWITGLDSHTGNLGLGEDYGTARGTHSPSQSWIAIATRTNHSLALAGNGTLWAWGNNDFGQLGFGHNNPAFAPTEVSPAATWRAMAVGENHSVGIRRDGTLWAWGANASGQLGLGDTVPRTRPERIGAWSDWINITAGDGFSLGLRADGSLWAWGWNGDGQLGLGNTSQYLSPTRVGTDSNWASVSAGSWHVVGVRRNGSLWAWGWNRHGNLGLGDLRARSSPTRVGTASNWQSVSAGNYHTMAIQRDGTLWAWGLNINGELGLGDYQPRYSPSRVGTQSNWLGVSAGNTHTLALQAGGTLWGWGSNSRRQVQFESSDGSNSPQLLAQSTQWIGIAAGSHHSFALTDQGVLWAWGHNGNGRLGLGTSSDRSVFSQIVTAP